MVLNEHTPEYIWKDVPVIDFAGDVDASSAFLLLGLYHWQLFLIP